MKMDLRVHIFAAAMMLGALGTAAAQTASTGSARPLPSGAVAAGAGATLDRTALDRTLSSLEPAELDAIGANPQIARAVVEQELIRAVLLREATAQGVATQPRVALRAERASQDAIIDAYLAKATEPPATVPTDAQIRQAYDANAAALVGPEQYNLFQIFVAVPEGADAATVEARRQRIAQLRARAAASSAQFMTVARENSDDTSGLGGSVPARRRARNSACRLGPRPGERADPHRGRVAYPAIRRQTSRPACHA
jgi:hypothetical protein